MNLLRALVLLTACFLSACTSPWGGDIGCLSLASYVERVECQSRTHRTVSSDEELRRQALRPASSSDKSGNTADPLCYVKAGESEKPCAK